MLTIITGRTGSGKSGRLINEIAARARAGERGLTLVVPPHFTDETERRLCAACGDGMSLRAEALSFERMCPLVFARAGGLARHELGDMGRLLVMSLAMRDAGPSLRVLGRLAKPERLKTALETVQELLACAVTPEALAEAAEETAGVLGNKLHDISLLYAAYLARLERGGPVRERLADAGGELARLPDALLKSGWAHGRRFYLDGFTLFTARELEIIRALLEQAEVTVSLTCSASRPALFAAQLRALGDLRRLAMSAGVAISERELPVTAEKPVEISRLEREFFSPEPPSSYEAECTNVRLFECETPYEECRFAALRVKELARAGLRWRDMTVAARGFEDYRGFLEKVFAEEGVPLFLSGGTAFSDKPEAVLIYSALECTESGFEYDDVMSYVKTGLAGLSAAESDELENYAFTWNIHGSLWSREEGWTFHPDGYGRQFDEASRLKLARINELRERVRLPLVALRRRAAKERTARGQASALFAFLEEISLPATLEERARAFEEQGRLGLRNDYSQLWQALCDALDESVEILGDEQMSFSEFSRLFRLMLSGCTIGSIPPALDAVTGGDISRLAHRGVGALVLLGAEDGRLPPDSAARGLFTDAERERLRSGGIGVPSGAEGRMENENIYIYYALSKPSLSLDMTRPLHSMSGGELRASYVFSRTLELLNISPSLWKAPARERLAGFPRSDELSPEAVRALYGSKFYMTASRAERFADCRFAYFMQYGLKAAPRKAAAFEAPEAGTFMHYILENVLREARGNGGLWELGEAGRRELTEQFIGKFVHDELHDFRDKSPRFRHLFLRLAAGAYEIVENMAEELSLSEFEPVRFELRFGADGDLPPVVIRTEHAELQLTGVADRVDMWPHNGETYLRIVDYKTGTKEFSLSDLRYGLNMQMLIYLFALTSAGEKTGEAVSGEDAPLFPPERGVPAGVLYAPARGLIQDDDGNEKTLTRSGLILGENEVVEAMERGIEREGRFIPVKLKKDGYSGSLATREQFSLLRRAVSDALASVAEALASGDVCPSPAKQGARFACRFCDWRAACQFSAESDAVRVMERINDKSFWERLQAAPDGQ